jgi:aconitate hydratase
LINFGIIPLTFVDKSAFDIIQINDILEIKNVRDSLNKAKKLLTVNNLTQGLEFNVENDLSDRERDIILAGGKLNYTCR